MFKRIMILSIVGLLASCGAQTTQVAMAKTAKSKSVKKINNETFDVYFIHGGVANMLSQRDGKTYNLVLTKAVKAMSKYDFSKHKEGDLIKVTGTASKKKGEYYIQPTRIYKAR